MPNPYARDTSITANNSTNPAILGANKQLTGNQTNAIQNNRINTNITDSTSNKTNILNVNVSPAKNAENIKYSESILDRAASKPSGYLANGSPTFGSGRSSNTTIFISDSSKYQHNITVANGGAGQIYNSSNAINSAGITKGANVTITNVGIDGVGLTIAFSKNIKKYKGKDYSNFTITFSGGSAVVTNAYVKADGSLHLDTNISIANKLSAVLSINSALPFIFENNGALTTLSQIIDTNP